MENEKKFIASVSKLTCYGLNEDDPKGCPRKYKYRYIDKLPTKQFDHFRIGNFAHKVLELWGIKIIANRSPEEAMREAFLEGQRTDEGKECSQEQKELVKAWLKEYLKRWQPSNIINTEMKFRYKLNDEIVLTGIIDRIDIAPEEKKATILDYKTTKDKSFLNDFQLASYILALQEDIRFKDMKLEAAYVLLRHDSEQLRYSFTPEDISQTEALIINTVSRINSDTEYRTNPSSLCNFCDYKAICMKDDIWHDINHVELTSEESIDEDTTETI